jgi:predicted alpha/beta superfamily hydrolase
MSDESKPRGAARFTPEQRAAFGRMGGKKAHENGRAHQFTPEEARAASAKRKNVKKKEGG